MARVTGIVPKGNRIFHETFKQYFQHGNQRRLTKLGQNSKLPLARQTMPAAELTLLPS